MGLYASLCVQLYYYGGSNSIKVENVTLFIGERRRRKKRLLGDLRSSLHS